MSLRASSRLGSAQEDIYRRRALTSLRQMHHWSLGTLVFQEGRTTRQVDYEIAFSHVELSVTVFWNLQNSLVLNLTRI